MTEVGHGLEPIGSGAGWTKSADVIGQPMPVVLGYMRKYPLMTDAEVARTQRHLAEYARDRGYTLGTIYIENLETDPKAFKELLEGVNRIQAPAVVVPTSIHLGKIDCGESKWAQLRQATRAHVLVAGASP
ncbi:MAG: hypothetical protein QOG10_6864 [Kribbellaceae bacterium]|nr:hypothetical protein [Kribbellaceae bacterium]